MNKIRSRAKFLLILVLTLTLGMGVFLFDYARNSENWVMHSGSPHIYESGKLGCGVITDREQVLLMNLNDGRTYAQSQTIRSAFLHWLGDRRGNISAPVLNTYAKEMSGFDPVSGLYAYGGIGGVMRLTLSARLQQTALEAMGSYKGTIAIYNYRTGELLCAVSTPTFDPDNEPDLSEDTAGNYTGVYMNRFLQSSYAPGSIFKIVTLAAALECVPDIEEQIFECTGLVEYGIDKVTCESAHGTMTLGEAFSRSCNCSFAKIAQLVGGENLQRYAQQFGITTAVSFDGVTSAKGRFEAQNAAPVQLAWSAIGQHTDLINPCRYLSFVGAIASDGCGVSPYVVGSVKTDGKETYHASAQSGERIMSQQTAEKIQNYMRITVSDYYGDDSFPGLSVCAKSGTAEVGAGRRPNAMFTGFVSDEKYPIAFIVCIEDGGYGRPTCVPVLAPVLAQYKAMIDGE